MVRALSQVIYFVLWVIFGNYICLTLFLAIVMEAFESHFKDKESQERKLALRKSFRQQYGLSDLDDMDVSPVREGRPQLRVATESVRETARAQATRR